MRIIVVNEQVYSRKVSSVDICNLKDVTQKSFYANVLIVTLGVSGVTLDIKGFFSYRQFEDEYGFIFAL